MIGHYLLTLTPEQEDWVLTRTMLPCRGGHDWTSGPCLVQTALGNGVSAVGAVRVARRPLTPLLGHNPQGRIRPGWARTDDEWSSYHMHPVLCPAWAYDYACWRFGHERVNAAIRNRILANQARRTLAPMAVAV